MPAGLQAAWGWQAPLTAPQGGSASPAPAGLPLGASRHPRPSAPAQHAAALPAAPLDVSLPLCLAGGRQPAPSCLLLCPRSAWHVAQRGRRWPLTLCVSTELASGSRMCGAGRALAYSAEWRTALTQAKASSNSTPEGGTGKGPPHRVQPGSQAEPGSAALTQTCRQDSEGASVAWPCCEVSVPRKPAIPQSPPAVTM